MKKLRQEFKQFRETVLRLLWWQWNALGAAGHGKLTAESLIDPEALLLVSLSLGRYDARLFDEIADWLFLNGEFINVQRLSLMLKTMPFHSDPQLSALAAYLCRTSEHRPKWRRLSEAYSAAPVQSFFFSIDGKPLPVGQKKDPIFLSRGLARPSLSARGHSQPFPAEKPPAFLLRLRALIGVSSRCEMLCLLAGGAAIHPAEAARRAVCHRRTAQNALKEMAQSGMVECLAGGREKSYRLYGTALQSLFPAGIRWTNWAAFYSGIEILWYGCENVSDKPLTLSSDLRRCALEARPFFNDAKTGLTMTDPSRTPGEAYTSVFMKDLLKITSGFERLV
jgi:hypothetical protein